ncbi:MAG: tripartite tricarboxylate transporter substrate-binding protein [Tardiphaga sp.]|jgi:tripartite-type tricarboxylate transporter receptor subunit TctC
MKRRQFLHLAVGATAAPYVSRSAFAQAYPSRAITMIVPFAAGGPTDVIGRVLADRMRQSLGQTVVVENTTGAGGTAGAGRLARSAPDGYIMGIGQNGSHVITGATYSNLPYDLLKDFEPLTLICITPFMVVSRKGVPAKDLKSFIAWLKDNPNKTVGTAGQGSISHVCGLIFQTATDTKLQFVPYRGIAPAMQDIVAGNLDAIISDPVATLQQVRAGNVQAYAVCADKRLPSAPDIPTVDEAGLPGYHVALWHGLWLPRGTPKPIMDRLHAAAVEALADPAVRSKLESLGQDIYPRERQTPQALASQQKAEIEKWWPIIKAGNIKVE